MRNPPNYGSVIDLGKNRRKPLAVRIPVGKKLLPDKREIMQYKYIGYFERTTEGKKQALQLLADYNSGKNIEIQYTGKCPTFKQLAEEWTKKHLERSESSKGKYPASSAKAYRLALKKCSSIHNMPIDTIKFQAVQDIADNIAGKSESVVSKTHSLLNNTFELARKYHYIKNNFIDDVCFTHKIQTESIHREFTQEELDYLWEHSDDSFNQIVLIMIYTGLRASELLDVKIENIHLDERYMIAGMKTEAGTNRTIPLNRKIMPFLESLMSKGKIYLLTNPYGRKYSYTRFYSDVWQPQMTMDHKPHDTRYTTATILDRAGANQNAIKDIIGHARQGITNKIYVKKNLDDLLEAIDLI